MNVPSVLKGRKKTLLQWADYEERSMFLKRWVLSEPKTRLAFASNLLFFGGFRSGNALSLALV